MIKKMPEFKFILNNTNGRSINLELIDLFSYDSYGCKLTIWFILNTNETDVFLDAAILGLPYNQRYSSVEIDYDNMKIAFSGRRDSTSFERD